MAVALGSVVVYEWWSQGGLTSLAEDRPDEQPRAKQVCRNTSDEASVSVSHRIACLYLVCSDESIY